MGTRTRPTARTVSIRRCVALAVIAITASACAGPAGSTGNPGDPASNGKIAVSDTLYPPAVECMLEAGATVIEVVGGYEFDMSGVEDPGLTGRECAKLWNPAQKSDSELKEIYDQWLDDADCLRGLGYHPDPAPTFETFAADWRADGPWMPIDGVDAPNWSSEAYAAAKKACGLDMYARG